MELWATIDVGAHVGLLTVLCHESWPEARIVAVDPHSERFELLERNTAHIPGAPLLRTNAVVTNFDGTCLIAAAVPHNRFGNHVLEMGNELELRLHGSGIEATAILVESLWARIGEFGIKHVELQKLDCAEAEHAIVEALAATGRLADVCQTRGERHGCIHRPQLAKVLAETHIAPVAANAPHDFGQLASRRRGQYRTGGSDDFRLPRPSRTGGLNLPSDQCGFRVPMRSRSCGIAAARQAEVGPVGMCGRPPRNAVTRCPATS
ncbi:MAG: FkbM family methyltransferase [Pirellulales bacterium]|nr:FkbM family methyltransferase [Pirellulales bacterium]